MALPANGQVSTSNLETEYAGLIPGNKTFHNYATAVGSSGNNTNIFYSKKCPTASTPQEYAPADIDFVYISAVVNPQSNQGVRFTIQMSASPNFTNIIASSTPVSPNGQTTIQYVFTLTNAPTYYFRVKIEFGINYSHMKYSSTYTFNNNNF